MNEASKKIQQELETFKKDILARKPENIYTQSMNIIFTEGTAWYTKELAEASKELAVLILVEGKTLAECTQHVMKYARSVCDGCNGDLPTEKFHKVIWEYFKMPVKVASTAIKDAKERAKAEAAERSAKSKAAAAARSAQRKVEEDRKKREETGQLSMFDMFSMATSDKKKTPAQQPNTNEESNVNIDAGQHENDTAGDVHETTAVSADGKGNKQADNLDDDGCEDENTPVSLLNL